jgi:hypothetical protein
MAIKYRFDKDFDYKVRDKQSGNLLATLSHTSAAWKN